MGSRLSLSARDVLMCRGHATSARVACAATMLSLAWSAAPCPPAHPPTGVHIDASRSAVVLIEFQRQFHE